ncbi:Hint domain-containing protein [Ponticoccus sp. SC2-23]|uniref:Hint domain-containing protein n=1 Tax=Alexandriicola marinus TaxID=2081710 RepID=UPI000FDB4E51|nr:Hint domain-containing protein [Alexandriicola marinus]MBM1219448.1 Hint domain-containing protein [Ponticoccus sp. SC6-9]MBM1223480.1 Hint domain-containing protein [Ponticoccus sp. SC6-15]MBM1229261.1 Hint domain-containing protein [Ponticoccus sp. SC6-38]MBM1232446.1 Hint domain-containing protein [Ponticoccus sp. SC6-45]MBM1237604.1 Hint domain-containing protein [Ponticoccus sp. SC6-49]MBM1241457.1 Hint domain-containing protein [Ponticoccus sp. SC2-64]MBM1245970.1 Hint domain-contai
MAQGYLVQLGDGSLNPDDTIALSVIGFEIDQTLGGGSWSWSGTDAGVPVTNQTETGTFYLGSDGNVYFVPDSGTKDDVTSASATTTPTYADEAFGSSGDDVQFGDGGSEIIYGGATASPTSTGADTIDGGDGQDVIYSGDGADTIRGGGDDDVIFGGDGNDEIYGDQFVPPATGTETLNWIAEGASGTDLSAGFIQDTGGMQVSVSFTNDGSNTAIQTSTSTQYVGATGLATNSGLYLTGNGGPNVTTSISFGAESGSGLSNEVENVVFVINDVDISGWQDIITVNAYDENGNPVVVTLTALGNDTVTGQTVSGAGGTNDTQDVINGAVLVEIAGPVSSIEIIYENGGTSGQALWITDIQYDTMVPDDGNDLIDAGAGDDIVFGGGGDDTIYGRDGNDSVSGDAGNDILSGEEGADTLSGELGDDQVLGGAGGDVLFGGAGDDFIGGDTIWLDPAEYASVASAATTLTVINDSDAAIQLWWIDGTGSLVAYGTIEPGQTYVQSTFEEHNWVLRDEDGHYLALIEGAANQTYVYGDEGLGDSIVAGDGNDIIEGQFGDDIIDAGAGDDIIYGGSGDDDIEAMTGNDTAYGGAGNDVIDDEFDAGTDGSGNDLFYGGDGNDIIHAGIDNDTIFGDAGNDQLSGEAGNDTIYGGDDADRITLYGTTGDDTIFGGEGTTGGGDFDTVDITNVTSAVGVTYTGNEAGSITHFAGNATFSEIEAFELGSGNDTLNATNDTLGVSVSAGAGDDTLTGGSGNDSLLGDAGNDVLSGGAGNDELYGGSGNDVIAGGAGDTLFGGDDADTITLDPSALDGSGTQTGTITVDGGTGGTTDNDTLDLSAYDGYRNLAVGTNADLDSVSGTVEVLNSNGDWITVNFAEIENLILPADGTVSGTAGDDIIDAAYTGDPDGDLVDGNDAFIAGHSGNDDLIEAGAGNDVVFSGDGNDTVFGGDGQDSLYGGGGEDTLAGGDGNDNIQSGSGNDSIDGGAGNDLLYGQGGNDAIYGGTGNDQFFAGTGTDALYGGEGTDTFQFSDTDGINTVVGGETADAGLGDILNTNSGSDATIIAGGNESGTMTQGGLSVTYSEIEWLQTDDGNDTVDLTADGSDIKISAYAGDDSVIGGSGANVIDLGTGNDTVDAGAGNDTLFGSDGDDTFIMTGTFGDDVITGGELDETTGDTLDASALTGDISLLLSAAETGTLMQGTNEASFSQIETVILGSGDDSVTGSVGNDTVATNTGADTVDMGAGDDTVDLGLLDSAVDTVVLQNGDGADVLFNFEAPVYNGDGTFTGGDQLDVSGLLDLGGDPVNTGDVVLSDSNGDGSGDAILTFPDGTSVMLVGVSVSTLSSPLALEAMGIPLDLNYTVDGTAGDDVIDFTYVDDPDGDQIDRGDALDGSNDDIVLAGDGNDEIYAGEGNDVVYGGTGNDVIDGGFGFDTLFGDAGDDIIDFGFDNGGIAYGGDGNDEIVSYDAGGVEIHGDAGDDFILAGVDNDTIFGGTGNDDISAYGGQDTIYGGAGNDLVDGMGGADFIYGDAGDDTIFGGGDNDLIVVNETSGSDTIGGGETGNDNDTLDFASTTDTGGVNILFTGDEAGDYDIGTGAADGTFTEIENLFLTDFDDTVDATNDSFGVTIDGGTGDDDITGGTGDDLLYGGIGDDTVSGGAGNDSVIGEAGNDILSGDVGNDFLNGVDGNDVLYGGGGVDAIEAGIGDDTLYGGADDDSINGDQGNDTVFGGDGNDFIRGSFGNDTVYGGEGDDYVWGGYGDDLHVVEDNFGNDTYFGDSEDETLGDTLDFSAVASDLTIDLTDGNSENGSFTDGTSTATFTEIENIILGAGVDTLVLSDTSGDDVVQGFVAPFADRDGNYTGQDQLDVSNMTSDGSTPVHTGNVVVSDDGNGNAVLTFPSGASITLIGVVPADVSDPAALEAMGIPADPRDGTVSGTAGGDVINAGYAGDPEGDLVDNNDAILPGDSGNDDLIEAGAGDDFIIAGDGNDEIYGGADSDTFIQSDTDGVDVIYGGETGTDGDRIDFNPSADPGGVTVTFNGDEQGTYNVGSGAASGEFYEIEEIAGSGFNDTVDASADATGITVDGLAGDDTITGGDGNDALFGWADDDVIDGGLGDDMVDGDAGNDVLDGSAGNDVVVGDGGRDTLTGGTGNDQLYAGTGNDILNIAEGDLADGASGDDLFVLQDLGETSNATITVDGGSGDETTGDTLQLGDLADLSTLSATDDGTGSLSGSVTLDDGTILNFSEIENIICFTPGTRIATPRGARPVEELAVGDPVVTRDHGLQQIRWIGRRTVPGKGRLAPIRLKQGVLTGLERDLIVSPQHRLMFNGYRAELLFGEREVLVPALHLVDGIDACIEEIETVTYIHMLFDDHEIVYAEGAATESFHPGEVGLSAITEASRDEIFAIFPELRALPSSFGPAARRSLKRHEARLLV